MSLFEEAEIKTTEKDLLWPPDTPVACEGYLEDGSECGWKGTLDQCGTDVDSEGGEYPEYEVLVCPKCGEFSFLIVMKKFI